MVRFGRKGLEIGLEGFVPSSSKTDQVVTHPANVRARIKKPCLSDPEFRIDSKSVVKIFLTSHNPNPESETQTDQTV